MGTGLVQEFEVFNNSDKRRNGAAECWRPNVDFSSACQYRIEDCQIISTSVFRSVLIKIILIDLLYVTALLAL